MQLPDNTPGAPQNGLEVACSALPSCCLKCGYNFEASRIQRAPSDGRYCAGCFDWYFSDQAIFGGPCAVCRGAGQLETSPWDAEPCKYCNGTGAQLLRYHGAPVMEIGPDSGLDECYNAAAMFVASGASLDWAMRKVEAKSRSRFVISVSDRGRVHNRILSTAQRLSEPHRYWAVLVARGWISRGVDQKTALQRGLFGCVFAEDDPMLPVWADWWALLNPQHWADMTKELATDEGQR